MKKQILNLGKALNKAEQKQINGGSANCQYYQQYNLCFGPQPGCLPCGRIDDYPGASTCGLFTDISCEDNGSFVFG